MAKLSVKPGSTDVSIQVFIPDSSSTTGAGLTGLTFETASLTCYYCRPGAAAAALALATQTVYGAHSDGGFKEIDATNMPGWYRLDLSDAIVAAGVRSVGLHLQGATNMAPVPLEIDLSSDVNVALISNDATAADNLESACDSYSATRGLSGTALPDAAADAAGGLPISDAGALDMDAILSRIGTPTNTGGTATLAAILGDPANSSFVTRAAALKTILDKLGFTGTDPYYVKADTILVEGAAPEGAADVVTSLEAEGSHLTLIKAKTDYLPAATAGAAGGLSIVGSAMTLADDAITAAKFDESTAFPLKSADTGATAVARPGDEMDLVDAPNATAVTAIKDAVQAAGTTLATLLSRLVGTIAAGTHTAQTGDAYARLGAPAGASIAADIATRLATAGYTAPPSAVANAAAVWAAVERTLTAFGFTIEATVDEEALALAIVAAIGEEGLVDETAIALAITTALGSLSVTVASPVGSGGTITIHAGDDYLDAEGRSIAFTIADATHTYLLDDGTAVVLFKSAQATWTATDITSTAGGYIVKFEPDAADTAAVTYKQGYEVEATLTSTSVVTLCTGNLVVVRDIPAGA